MNKTNQVQANIHPGAKIADGVIIEPFATIYENVEIGEGSWIGPNAVIMDGARLGKNCKVFPGAVISAIPQDLKYQGEETTAEIGDNTIIRECVTINKGTRAKGKTTVGNNSLVIQIPFSQVEERPEKPFPVEIYEVAGTGTYHRIDLPKIRIVIYPGLSEVMGVDDLLQQNFELIQFILCHLGIPGLCSDSEYGLGA